MSRLTASVPSERCRGRACSTLVGASRNAGRQAFPLQRGGYQQMGAKISPLTDPVSWEYLARLHFPVAENRGSGVQKSGRVF
jgi:hypothetical protein